MITATITAKGQITLPSEVRRALNLDVGDRVIFEESEPGIYIVRPAPKVSVTVLKGMFGKPRKRVSLSQMNAVIAKRGASAK